LYPLYPLEKLVFYQTVRGAGPTLILRSGQTLLITAVGLLIMLGPIPTGSFPLSGRFFLLWAGESEVSLLIPSYPG